MNLEEKIKGIYEMKETSDERLYYSNLYLPITVLFANNIGLVDFATGGDENGEMKLIGLTIAVPKDSPLPTTYDKDYYMNLSVIRNTLNNYYNRDLDDILNGPHRVLIGFPRSIIDNFVLRCDQNENNPTYYMIDQKTPDEDYATYYTVNDDERLGYKICIGIYKKDLENVRQYSPERFYEYITFVLYICLITITNGDNQEGVEDRLKCMIAKAAEYYERSDNNDV